jgi:hypothetical protein
MPNIVTPAGRASYPNVFEPRAYGDQEPEFGVNVIFDDDADLTELEAAINAVAAAKWGKKLPSNLQTPIRVGDDESKPEYFGKRFISAKKKAKRGKPGVVDERRKPITQESGLFYPGVVCRISCRPFAWSYMGKNGISLGLGNVQRIGDGERFGGSDDPNDEFTDVPVEAEELY